MPINKKRKLGPKTVDCVFLGYAIHGVGYRFLIISSKIPDMIEGAVTLQVSNFWIKVECVNLVFIFV